LNFTILDEENSKMGSSHKERINSIDLLRGVVIILMALDHVRMYFGEGSWYADPTDLTTTTTLLFFTRWITHFCAPVFIFLAGTSAALYGARQQSTGQLFRYLFTRGLWLIFLELVIVNFAWTFDITFSFHFLQVIWAIGVSMVVLAFLVYLPKWVIFAFGIVMVAGHNLLDPIQMEGTTAPALIWYILHQKQLVVFSPDSIVDVVYQLIPLVGLIALGYIFGTVYLTGYSPVARKKWLLIIGTVAILMFLILRGFNLYGDPNPWSQQPTLVNTFLSFLNTTKYPTSLQFLLMTIGPALVFLALTEGANNRIKEVVLTFGRVSLFFYILHVYVIHFMALVALEISGWSWTEYIITAEAFLSQRLASFGFDLYVVYLVWILVLLVMYPLSRWYRLYKKSHPEQRLLSYI
jgi:uncharacterized membrane protein